MYRFTGKQKHSINGSSARFSNILCALGGIVESPEDRKSFLYSRCFIDVDNTALDRISFKASYDLF